METPPLPMYASPPPPPLPMTGIECPTNHDVKSGRGVSTNAHPGNERFRSLVNCNKELYVTSTKRQKMAISRSIVEAVRSLDPPGRFLEKDPETGLWSDIGDKKAIEKTSQALRDGAAALRKQLSADMHDPDFLSAVFDSNSPIPSQEHKKASKKKGKPPAKGHRRVKSNPTVGTATKTKALMKKARSGEAVPLSPKNSLSLPVIPRPPQSPISPGSDRASPGYERQRPSNQDPFRRMEDLGSYPGSPPGYGLPTRSASFDYHDIERGEHHGTPPHHPGSPPPPRAYGSYSSPPSPSGYGAYTLPPPYPMPSPRGRHMPHSPRVEGSHRMPSPGYRHGPSSPTVAWSPRHFHYSGQSLSPHPHLHPSDMPSYRSPEYRPTLSPRMHYTVDPGRMSPGLSVPTLGVERDPHAHCPPSPTWREQSNPYYYPRSPNGAPHPRGHPEFLPPPPSSRHRGPEYKFVIPTHITAPTRYPDMSESENNRHCPPYQHPDRNESFHESRDGPAPQHYHHEESERLPSDSMVPQRDFTSRSSPSTPINVKIEDSFDSPAAVEDISREDMITPVEEGIEVILPDIELKRSSDSDDDYPFDEDNPVDEYMRMSPLPYDGNEDPTTLMELPDNLLKLPISPVGPQDDPTLS